MGFTDFLVENFQEFLTYTGFANATEGNLIMIVVGMVLIYQERFRTAAAHPHRPWHHIG